MISHEHRIIFLHIPKNAGTSVESALGHRDGFAGKGGQDHRTLRQVRPFRARFNRLFPAENLLETLRHFLRSMKKYENPNSNTGVSEQQFGSYYKFSMVRNPWSRVYSWYRNVTRDERHRRKLGIDGDLSLRDFLLSHADNWALRPQLYWLKDFDGSIGVDYVGRFENAQESFAQACAGAGIPSVQLPVKNTGHGEPDEYVRKYDDESMELVAARYREEIELFGYSFD